jgi:hypothetical protein
MLLGWSEGRRDRIRTEECEGRRTEEEEDDDDDDDGDVPI